MKISTLESWEDHLYIGTNDGFVLYYLLESGESPSGKLTYRCGKQAQQSIGISKPIEMIQVLPVHRKLLVLCDGNVVVLRMATLTLLVEARVVKGVTLLCRDEGADLALSPDIDFTAVKKKGLYSFECGEAGLLPHKTLKDLDEGDHKDTIALARDGATVCAAQKRQYDDGAFFYKFGCGRVCGRRVSHHQWPGPAAQVQPGQLARRQT